MRQVGGVLYLRRRHRRDHGPRLGRALGTAGRPGEGGGQYRQARPDRGRTACKRRPNWAVPGRGALPGSAALHAAQFGPQPRSRAGALPHLGASRPAGRRRRAGGRRCRRPGRARLLQRPRKPMLHQRICLRAWRRRNRSGRRPDRVPGRGPRKRRAHLAALAARGRGLRSAAHARQRLPAAGEGLAPRDGDRAGAAGWRAGDRGWTARQDSPAGRRGGRGVPPGPATV